MRRTTIKLAPTKIAGSLLIAAVIIHELGWSYGILLVAGVLLVASSLKINDHEV